MADNKMDSRTNNQPSHEAQVKGGEQSHKSGTGNTPPSREDAARGGQHSHTGNK
jgi:hypothetical protein